jgi:muramoyltetrapeptide carboxypeptidase
MAFYNAYAKVSTMMQAKQVIHGSIIGTIATGSPVSPERYALGVGELENRGYKVKSPIDPCLFYGKYDHGYANGSAVDRARALDELVQDDNISAVITARGGYGTLDILPHVNFDQLKAQRKLIVGCSDATALLVQCVVRASLPAIHGPVIASSFADSAKDEASRRSVDALLSMLSDPTYRFSVSCEGLRAGQGEGAIMGGNLSMLAALLGTPWDFDYRGVVLVLEEVGEAPFRVHRMLTQLKYAGKLESLSALVFGRFARCTAVHGPGVMEVIKDFVSDILAGSKYPVLAGFEFGHWGESQPVPLGCRALVRDGIFSLLESPVG